MLWQPGCPEMRWEKLFRDPVLRTYGDGRFSFSSSSFLSMFLFFPSLREVSSVIACWRWFSGRYGREEAKPDFMKCVCLSLWFKLFGVFHFFLWLLWWCGDGRSEYWLWLLFCQCSVLSLECPVIAKLVSLSVFTLVLWYCKWGYCMWVLQVGSWFFLGSLAMAFSFSLCILQVALLAYCSLRAALFW
jgi:hypothetical protein